jgi:ketosteroid isomerase-like protein
MSEENVELVRSYYEALHRMLSAHAAAPGRIEDAPFIEEVFGHLDEEVEWRWPLTPDTFSGRDGLLRAATDWLELVDDWQIDLEEVVDAGDSVVTTQLVRGQGKGSGAPSDQRIYSVITFRNQRILLIKDYVDRRTALEAAGRSTN